MKERYEVLKRWELNCEGDLLQFQYGLLALTGFTASEWCTDKNLVGGDEYYEHVFRIDNYILISRQLGSNFELRKVW